MSQPFLQLPIEIDSNRRSLRRWFNFKTAADCPNRRIGNKRFNQIAYCLFIEPLTGVERSTALDELLGLLGRLRPLARESRFEELAGLDEAKFKALVRDVAHMAIKRFFKMIPTLASGRFVLRNVPTFFRRIRQGSASVRVEPGADCKLLTPGYAYFANSYAFSDVPEGWARATFDHGGTFVAAVERGPMLACQFHPELSGTWGRSLLSRWLAA